MFSAFLLLALLHLVQSFSEPHSDPGFQIDLEVAYALISLLLLMGMAHLHAILRGNSVSDKNKKSKNFWNNKCAMNWSWKCKERRSI